MFLIPRRRRPVTPKRVIWVIGQYGIWLAVLYVIVVLDTNHALDWTGVVRPKPDPLPAGWSIEPLDRTSAQSDYR